MIEQRVAANLPIRIMRGGEETIGFIELTQVEPYKWVSICCTAYSPWEYPVFVRWDHGVDNLDGGDYGRQSVFPSVSCHLRWQDVSVETKRFRIFPWNADLLFTAQSVERIRELLAHIVFGRRDMAIP